MTPLGEQYPAADDVQALRTALMLEAERIGTPEEPHSEDCWQWHPYCLLWRAADVLRRYRDHSTAIRSMSAPSRTENP